MKIKTVHLNLTHDRSTTLCGLLSRDDLRKTIPVKYLQSFPTDESLGYGYQYCQECRQAPIVSLVTLNGIDL